MTVLAVALVAIAAIEAIVRVTRSHTAAVRSMADAWRQDFCAKTGAVLEGERVERDTLLRAALARTPSEMVGLERSLAHVARAKAQPQVVPARPVFANEEAYLAELRRDMQEMGITPDEVLPLVPEGL